MNWYNCEHDVDEDDYEHEDIEDDETMFGFESNFLPSKMTEKEWDRIHDKRK